MYYDQETQRIIEECNEQRSRNTRRSRLTMALGITIMLTGSAIMPSHNAREQTSAADNSAVTDYLGKTGVIIGGLLTLASKIYFIIEDEKLENRIMQAKRDYRNNLNSR